MLLGPGHCEALIGACISLGQLPKAIGVVDKLRVMGFGDDCKPVALAVARECGRQKDVPGVLRCLDALKRQWFQFDSKDGEAFIQAFLDAGRPDLAKAVAEEWALNNVEVTPEAKSLLAATS